MNSVHVRNEPRTSLGSILLIRVAVGLIFFTQGILKYIDPRMGVLRFERIGFPHAYFTAHFVGTFEIVCGFLVLIGLWTRLAAIPLVIVISTAIATTRIPELSHANQGFWFMVSDARADFAMLCSLTFLIIAGGWALVGKFVLRKMISGCGGTLGAPSRPIAPQIGHSAIIIGTLFPRFARHAVVRY